MGRRACHLVVAAIQVVGVCRPACQSRSRGPQALCLEKGELVAASDKEWTPNSLMPVIDGAEAACWTWVSSDRPLVPVNTAGKGSTADPRSMGEAPIPKKPLHAKGRQGQGSFPTPDYQ